VTTVTWAIFSAITTALGATNSGSPLTGSFTGSEPGIAWAGGTSMNTELSSADGADLQPPRKAAASAMMDGRSLMRSGEEVEAAADLPDVVGL
jgi:hypothetical protein